MPLQQHHRRVQQLPGVARDDKSLSVAQVLLSVERALCEWGSSESARWLGYLSSTSVYGDWGGAWVNEGCGLTLGLFINLVYSQHGCQGMSGKFIAA